MIKGRGSQKALSNPFSQHSYQVDPNYLEHLSKEEENPFGDEKTNFTFVRAKSIINPVKSPDIGHAWSLNPYQGCEHGCSYCYARNSHTYWSLEAGLDFERQILVKENAVELLQKEFQKKTWQGEPIMLSGNTDCYQPVERKLGLTRKILEVFLHYGNPVGIISKNALMERDMDLLEALHQKQLLKVAISLNSLDENLRRKMEPRTASVTKRLKLIRTLSEKNIPCSVMIAPIIPGLNSHEIWSISEAVAEAGAYNISHTILRLNGQLAEVFLPWLESHYPERAKKVIKLVKSCHGGELNDSVFGRRMRGEGQLAQQIQQQINLARKKFFPNPPKFKYDRSHFHRPVPGQYRLL